MRFLKKIVCCVLAAMMFFACQKKSEIADETAEYPLPRLRTVAVQTAEIADTLQLYGRIAFRDETLLASQFEGRISNFSLLIGDRVSRGQAIATIIPPQREALMQLYEQSSADARNLLDSEIKTTTLRSPIDGVVIEVLRRNGDVVQRGEQMVHIGNVQMLQILADVPVKILPYLSKKQSLAVAFPGADLPAIELPVAAISPNVDPAKQAALLRINLPNPGGNFRPGMLVKISLVAERHSDALIVPRDAVLEEDGVFSVFVLAEHHLEKRTVVPGIMQPERIEITNGIAAGEKVAIEKVYSLVDGTEVQP